MGDQDKIYGALCGMAAASAHAAGKSTGALAITPHAQRALFAADALHEKMPEVAFAKKLAGYGDVALGRAGEDLTAYVANPIGWVRKCNGGKSSNAIIGSSVVCGVLYGTSCNFAEAHLSAEMMSRCLSASARANAAAVTIAHICGRVASSYNYEQILSIIGEGRRIGKQYLPKKYRDEFIRMMDMTPKGLCLGTKKDDPIKTLGMGAWALRELWREIKRLEMNDISGGSEIQGDLGAIFTEIIKSVASYGGDVSSNCAVAGAFLGAFIGRSKLPVSLIESSAMGKFISDLRGYVYVDIEPSEPKPNIYIDIEPAEPKPNVYVDNGQLELKSNTHVDIEPSEPDSKDAEISIQQQLYEELMRDDDE